MVKLFLDGRSNVVVPIVFLVIDTFAVILRVFAKRKTKHRLGTDDGWIFLALALFFVWSGMVIKGSPTQRLVKGCRLTFRSQLVSSMAR